MTAIVSPLRTSQTPEAYLSPAQVCALLPGMTEKRLENLRGAGKGPRYFKPTLKTVLYAESEVRAWVEASAVTTKSD